MSASNQVDQPLWRRPTPRDEDLAHQVEHMRQRHLLLDPRRPWDVDKDVLDPMYRTGRRFWMLFSILGGLVVMWGAIWVYQMNWGLGITGLNRPVMWALYIVNFVYFIGIGHAGTFISAALRVLKIEWRRPISRAAETLTVFALVAAAMFPLVHLGRSWKFYWLLPIPNQRQLWPSYHSPLLWDMTAILTYLTGSILFAYIGLLPDLAMARDHTVGWRHRLYEILALGWRGTEREWANQETALNVFSYVIIPVMFSVHTIVSWDFAMALQPGWHSSIFGPYFIIGALFSGVAAVILVLALIRKAMHLDYFLRDEHFDGMGKFLLLLSFAWAYFYFNDYLVAWYGQAPVDKVLQDLFEKGWAAPLWFLMLFSNVVLPWLTLWSRRIRTSVPALFFVCVFVQIGMYIERYLIVPTTLGRNALPFDWGIYIPHLPETLITVGAFALVGFLYILFSRIIPLIPVWEVYEGQVLQGLRRIGRALIPTRAEPGE
ncbi:MAG TPA: NrfD/PsrC family molybdoenzyme membrane anchor subunit [Anaerolineae bacterium]|nr:NrfD/PsrC family molybdoenzyme membrane anchor subunit [Anaerolineae bacterium]